MLDSGRIKMQAAADANYLSIALYEPVMLDNIAVRVIQEDRPEFLLPFQIKVINDQQSLRYKLVNAVSLSNNIPKSMTKRAYIKLALDLLTPFVKCRDWFLDYHYICVDPQFILYNKQNGGYLFVYMPELSLRSEDEEIISFFDSVLNRISISDDPYYQVSIMTYFRDGNVTLTEMYDMFWAEREKSGGMPTSEPAPTRPPVNDPIPTPPSGQEAVVQNPVTPPASGGSMFTDNSANKNEGGAAKGSGFLSGVFGGNKSDKKETTESAASNPPTGGGLFGGTAEAGSSAGGVADSNDFESLFGGSKPASGSGLFGSKKTEDKSSGGGLFGGKKTEDKSSGGGLFGGKKTEDKPSGGLFGGKKTEDKPSGGGLFGGNKPVSGASAQTQNPTPQPQPQPTPAPQPQPAYQPPMSGYGFGGDDFNSDETSIGDDGISRSYLELVDSRFPDVPREISLDFDKPYITIGRRTNDATIVDVPFPDHCKGISRQHARISRDGSGYFITDLGSAYHTLIDGRRLVPNMNEPIYDGMIITFVEEKPIRYRVRCGGGY